MKLYHIVAVSENGVIGKEKKLPWHFPADLKNFKRLTMGNAVIMGRKTFESIGRPLPGRENFVLTHSPKRNEEHLQFFDSLEAALRAVKTPRVFIIGGESLYRETLDRVDGIYLTRVEGAYEGDAFYPVPSVEELEKRGFKIVSRQRPPEEPKLEFIELERKRGQAPKVPVPFFTRHCEEPRRGDEAISEPEIASPRKAKKRGSQ